MAASSDAVREPSTATTTVSAGVISVKPAEQFHVTRKYVIVDVERADVDLEVLRQFACRPLDLERMRDDVHDTAALFHARATPDRNDVDRCVDRFGRGHALEVSRDRTIEIGVPRSSPQQNRFFLAADRRVDDMLCRRSIAGRERSLRRPRSPLSRRDRRGRRESGPRAAPSWHRWCRSRLVGGWSRW